MDIIQTIAVMLLFGALGILLFIAASGILNKLRNKTSNPGIQAVIDALLPYAYRGIAAGEALALRAMQNTDTALSGVDRKAIADSIYDLLPDTLVVGVISIPIKTIKTWVSRDRFEQLIGDEYQTLHVLILANEAFLTKSVDSYLQPTKLTPVQVAAINGIVPMQANRNITPKLPAPPIVEAPAPSTVAPADPHPPDPSVPESAKTG